MNSSENMDKNVGLAMEISLNAKKRKPFEVLIVGDNIGWVCFPGLCRFLKQGTPKY
jgi:hypothetical protein